MAAISSIIVASIVLLLIIFIVAVFVHHQRSVLDEHHVHHSALMKLDASSRDFRQICNEIKAKSNRSGSKGVRSLGLSKLLEVCKEDSESSDRLSQLNMQSSDILLGADIASLLSNEDVAILPSLSNHSSSSSGSGSNTKLDDHLHSFQKHCTNALFHKYIHENKGYKYRIDPFPHAVLDGLLPLSVLKAVSDEVPDEPTLDKNNCAMKKVCDVHGLCTHKINTCIRDHIQYGKSGFRDESQFGPATLALFSFIKSSRFIDFLERLTGIVGLIPDPHYLGSGIHQTVRNGYLGIHSDARMYNDVIMLQRRVNLFVFLNDDWKDEYNGHLELWSRDLKHCHKMISPILGRVAVFSSTDYSFHGHQTKLNCPPSKSRRSLALYYYTNDRPEFECFHNQCWENANTTKVNTACSSCTDPTCSLLNFTKKIYNKTLIKMDLAERYVMS